MVALRFKLQPCRDCPWCKVGMPAVSSLKRPVHLMQMVILLMCISLSSYLTSQTETTCALLKQQTPSAVYM